MILDLHPKVRMTLVQGRILGMRGGVEAALEFLDSTSSDSKDPTLEVLLLKAELLHLDHRESESQDVFDMDVQPKLNDLPPEKAVLLADNGTLLAHAQLSEGDDFYHLADQRRLLGVELWDHESAARIHEAVRRGHHNEALSLCWQQLLHAHDGLCWRRSQLAELDMARECHALGWPHEAAYHGMMGCDAKFIEEVAGSLLGETTHDGTRQTIDQVLPISQLTRHAAVVAKLLERIGDVIPDDRVGSVVEWLTERAMHVPTSVWDASLFEFTWKAVDKLSPRLTPEQALSFIDIAVGHPWFAKPTVHRRHVIDSVSACVRRVEVTELPRIAKSALPLALDQKSDVDYINSINLLCHLAERGDDALRKQLRSALYPSKQTRSNAPLIQVARHFGATVVTKEDLDKGALQTAQKLLCQVQHLEPGEEPAKLGGFGTLTKILGDGNKRLVVHIHGALHTLNALIEHRADISEQSLRDMITAVLDMIASSDNVISNRVALVESLRRLLDQVPSDLAQRAVDVLCPLAAGGIVESQAGMSHAEATNPLNPYKMDAGDPLDLRGISLMALSGIERRYPGTVAALHDDLLLQAMTAHEPILRAYGCAAARLSSELSDDEQMAALFCTTDRNPKTAAAALSVFRDIGEMNLERPAWAMLGTCLERGGRLPSVLVRRAVARVVCCVLASEKMPAGIAIRLRRLQQELSQDVSFAVRSEVSGVGG